MTGAAKRSGRRLWALAAPLVAPLVFGGLMAFADLPALAADDEADRGAPGKVISQALIRMPEGLPIEVSIYDDTEENLEIQAEVVEAMEKQGYLIQSGAPLELLLESEVVQAEFHEEKPNLGKIYSSNESEVGNRGSKRGVEAEVNVWSSSKDSLLGGRQTESTQSGEPRFHINAQLRDREAGKVLWQGDVFCEMITRDRTRLIRSMAEPLAESIGQTYEHKPFEIR